jgi:hypothetical protein
VAGGPGPGPDGNDKKFVVGVGRGGGMYCRVETKMAFLIFATS